VPPDGLVPVVFDTEREVVGNERDERRKSTRRDAGDDDLGANRVCKLERASRRRRVLVVEAAGADGDGPEVCGRERAGSALWAVDGVPEPELDRREAQSGEPVERILERHMPVRVRVGGKPCAPVEGSCHRAHEVIVRTVDTGEIRRKVERKLASGPEKSSPSSSSRRLEGDHTQPVIPCGLYCVASSHHFLGLVALLNSLRLTGNDAPLFVGDCGLTTAQRERLAPHVILADVDASRSPHLAKWAVPLAFPAEVTVLLDVDIIVTGSLDPLVAASRQRPVVFADPLWHRFDENWGRLLGLRRLRRGPYFNAGVIGLPARRAPEILALVGKAQTRIDTDAMWIDGGTLENPFYFGDQDVWNAVFAAQLEPNELLVLEQRLAAHPPFPRLRLVDERSLDCRYPDGTAPIVLHHVGDKPWLAQTRPNIYSRMITRLLLEDDLTLPLDRKEVPWRLREHATGDAARFYAASSASFRTIRGSIGIRRRSGRRSAQPDNAPAKKPPRGMLPEPDTIVREA
jgi:hypothetical protein